MSLISIILPVYNGEEFLKETIDSVINQTFQDWELIVVNDGSTDSTEKIADDYGKYDSRIKVISQSNLGLSSARNTGFAHCKGEVIGFLDADDKYLPECLTIISNRFRSPDLDLLISGYFYFQDSISLHTHNFQEKQISPNSLIQRNMAPPVAYFIRRELANKLEGFDPTLKSCEDWDFWIRAGKIGAKIYTIPEVLVGYRYVPNSMSRNPLVMYEALTEVSLRAGKRDERLPKDAPHNHAVELDYPSIRKKHLIRMLGVMLHQGKPREAADWYLKEKKVWNWEEEDTDWKGLASYLSSGYFFDPEQIEKLITHTASDLTEFFMLLGYSPTQSQSLIKMIFEPQLKRRNHLNYGKLFGGIKNKLGWY